MLGLSGLHLGTVVALVAGGVLAAPVAALLAGRMPPEVLGVAFSLLLVGGTVVRRLASTDPPSQRSTPRGPAPRRSAPLPADVTVP